MSLYTQNQNKNKIVSGAGGFVGSLTCYYDDDKPGQNIALTALEEMWYGHEECIDHPADSEYPTGINHEFRKLMIQKVRLSVLHRTGHDILHFDGVIHASSHPAQ